MEFYKNGKAVKINPIFQNGVEGQAIVLANVHLNEDNPFAAYSQPSIFIIQEKNEGGYVLMDADHNLVELPFQETNTWYFYPADEWGRWFTARDAEELRKKDGHIKKLQHDVDLLRSILIAQGFRVITEEQAEKIGIKQ